MVQLYHDGGYHQLLGRSVLRQHHHIFPPLSLSLSLSYLVYFLQITDSCFN